MKTQRKCILKLTEIKSNLEKLMLKSAANTSLSVLESFRTKSKPKVCFFLICDLEIASKETESKSDHNYSNKEPNNFNSNYSSVIIGVEDNVPKLDFNRLTWLKQRYSSNKIETKNNENGITKRSNTSKITHKRTSIIDAQGVKAIQPRKIDFNSYHKNQIIQKLDDKNWGTKHSQIILSKPYRKTTYSSKVVKKANKLRGVGGRYVYLGDSQDNSEDDIKILAVHSIDSSLNSISKINHSLCSSLTPKQKKSKHIKNKMKFGKLLTSKFDKDNVNFCDFI